MKLRQMRAQIRNEVHAINGKEKKVIASMETLQVTYGDGEANVSKNFQFVDDVLDFILKNKQSFKKLNPYPTVIWPFYNRKENAVQ